MKRKKLFWGMIAAALYVLLLVLLPIFEKASPEANILSIPLALWYSLTTLTTVGYGDLYPVTTAGRIIGVIFQLMSLGVLAVLVGAFVPLIWGRLLPDLKLRLRRKKEWFVFPVASDAAMTLARSLYAEDHQRVIIFCDTADRSVDRSDKLPFILSPHDPAALSRLKGDGRISVFCMDESGAENEQLAHELEGCACEVYCMTEHEPDRMPERRHCFDPYDSCARLYWRKFPLLSPAEKIVIVGDGKYAEAILAFGLELNVLDCEMHTQYRVFGDYDNFRRDHYRLSAFVSVDAPCPQRDCLFFSAEPWSAHSEWLLDASRIVVCTDQESDAVDILTELKRYFPVSCPIHAKISLDFDGVCRFGSAEELFSPEFVLRAGLNDTAMRMHEIYRRSAGGNAPVWSELSSFTRRSNIASAEHLLVKIRILLGESSIQEEPLTRDICQKAYGVFAAADEAEKERFRRIEHERWMRFHLMNNWTYAEKRDNAARLHPFIVPYESLSREEQLKNDFGWELLKEI